MTPELQQIREQLDLARSMSEDPVREELDPALALLDKLIAEQGLTEIALGLYGQPPESPVIECKPGNRHPLCPLCKEVSSESSARLSQVLGWALEEIEATCEAEGTLFGSRKDIDRIIRDVLAQTSEISDDKRSCTCPPDDKPPQPCPKKYALSDCVATSEQPDHLSPDMLIGALHETVHEQKGRVISATPIRPERPDDWADKPDQWQGAIEAAHPTITGKHKTYTKALEMVSNRHSKGSLVDLVNWLLAYRRPSEVDGLEREYGGFMNGDPVHDAYVALLHIEPLEKWRFENQDIYARLVAAAAERLGVDEQELYEKYNGKAPWSSDNRRKSPEEKP